MESFSDVRIYCGVSMLVTSVFIRNVVEDVHVASLSFMSKTHVSHVCLFFSFRFTFKSVVSLSRNRLMRFT